MCTFPCSLGMYIIEDTALYSGCARIQVNGEWKECVKNRVSVSGIQCRFPFDYGGTPMVECVEADGAEHCQTLNDEWEECAGSMRTSLSGKPCIFPFVSKGKKVYGCIKDG